MRLGSVKPNRFFTNQYYAFKPLLSSGYILLQCGLQPDIIPDFVYDEAFATYDEDGGGTITLDEFREFLMSHL